MIVDTGASAGPTAIRASDQSCHGSVLDMPLVTNHAVANSSKDAIKAIKNVAAAVHVKSAESQEPRMLLTSRKLLHGKCLDVENQIRGLSKAFGLRVGPVARTRHEARVASC